MNFGGRLRQLRESRHLNQSDLADSIGVSTVYVCDIEKNRRYPPDADKLRKWAHQMALSPEEEAELFDLAGQSRGVPGADIIEYLLGTPTACAAIRRIIRQKQEFNWNTIP